MTFTQIFKNYCCLAVLGEGWGDEDFKTNLQEYDELYLFINILRGIY